MARLLAVLLLVLVYGACGYRPVAGRLAADLPEDVRFTPFRVRNTTAELALTHVLLEASRAELGRMRLLAEQGKDEPAAVNVDLTLRRVSEKPASYSPSGEIIEYYGEIVLDYRVYDLDVTAPELAMGTQRIAYRYDFRPNPQDIRIFRYSAIRRSVSEWVRQLAWRTAAGLRKRQAVAEFSTETAP